MRIILAGQKSFGLAVYRAIAEAGHDIVAVWSPPSINGPFSIPTDALTGEAWPSEGPHRWMGTASRTPDHVRALEADLFVAAHSHDFISGAARAATRLGGIGYHPSLLPRHRGRDAVRWTIHLGDPIAGGSVYWLTDNVDGGPIAWRDWCFVESRRYAEAEDAVSWLWRDQLFPMGVRGILAVLNDLERGRIVEIPQEEEHATWEPSWERPPLHRPDLPQLGVRTGFTHVTTREGVG